MMFKQMGDPEQRVTAQKWHLCLFLKKRKSWDTWQDSTSTDGVTRVTNYTVKEINGNTATVSISGTETRDTKMEMKGMEIGTKTNGKFSGEETVDITTGVILQNNTTMDASGNISCNGTGNSYKS